jgi:hypothetical protein
MAAMLAAGGGCRGNTGEPHGEETAVAETAPRRSKETAMPKDYVITDEQKSWLMKVAKESSAAAARGSRYTPPEPDPDPSWTVLRDKGAAFVTLRRGSDGSLRGCIGHIIARVPLYECVAEMGRAATVQDTRFAPVTPEELPDIRYEISVLTPLEEVSDPERDVVVGRDGVVLSAGYHSGVFLPQVPVEQGWDLEEYLDNLCYKAGLMRRGCWRERTARLERFQAIVWEEDEPRE